MIQRTEQGCHVDRIDVEVDRETVEEAEKRCLFIAGMRCLTCATRVHNALLGVTGVRAVDVDLYSGIGQVWVDGQVSTEALVGAVRDAGDRTHHRYLAVVAKSG